MPSGSVTRHASEWRPPRRGRRRHDRTFARPPAYPLGRFALAYIAALVVWIGSKFLLLGGLSLQSFLLSSLVYLACGFVLTRYISRRVIFNQNFATIASVADAKLGTVLRWPVAVPYLIWQVFVARYF